MVNVRDYNAFKLNYSSKGFPNYVIPMKHCISELPLEIAL